MKYPDNSAQNVLGSPWWIKNTGTNLQRGSLIFAFVAHVDQTPYTLSPIGRKNSEEHDTAYMTIEPLSANAILKKTELPVAAMTLHHNEVWGAYRTKKRPCIVLGTGGPTVEKSLTRGKPNAQTAPTLLVAPFYGVIQNKNRSGYSKTFIEAVRHCEYPQFFWDILPLSYNSESLLRLDHLQPIGCHHKAYSPTDHILSKHALSFLDEMLHWLLYGGIREHTDLEAYLDLLERNFT